jgi:hypothetical protein
MRTKALKACLVTVIVTLTIVFVAVGIVWVWLRTSLPIETMPPSISQPTQRTQGFVELAQEAVDDVLFESHKLCSPIYNLAHLAKK